MYATSHPASIRMFQVLPLRVVTDTRADTPAAFPSVHFTSNWSTFIRPPASRTSCRILALSCQDTSDRHFTERDFTASSTIFPMVSSDPFPKTGTFLKVHPNRDIHPPGNPRVLSRCGL